MKTKYVFPFLFILAMSAHLFFNGCSSNTDKAKVIINLGNVSAGNTAYKSIMERLLQIVTSRAYAQVPPEVTSILVTVTGTGMPTIQESFPPTETTIVMSVDAGPNRVFTVHGKNPAGDVLYTGVSEPIDLSAGETATVTITMKSAGAKVYVANWGSDTVSVIDASSNTVITTINVGDGPGGVGANTATGKVYVANNRDGTVSVINSLTDTETGTINIIGSSTAFEPFAVGINVNTNKVYVTQFYVSDYIEVINGATDSFIKEVDTTGSYTFGVGVNPNTNKIYVSLWNPAAVINGSSDTFSTVVSGGSWGETRGVGVNPATNRVYVADLTDDVIQVVNGSTDSFITSITVGTDPYGVGVNTSTNKIYVANEASNNVSVINGATNVVIATIPVGTSPMGVAVNPSTNRIYVANSGANSVTVINGATDSVITTITTGIGTNPALLDVMY